MPGKETGANAAMPPHSPLSSNDSRIEKDRKVQWIIFIGFIFQVLYCITQPGFYHPDQHFQIIEFSSYQLGEPNGATSVWELASRIRPTLQVYLFSAFVKGCRWINIEDAYQQMTLLRLLFSLLAFAVFNAIALYYFKKEKQVLYLVLLLVNLGFALPYIRTLYSSETASAIVFFGAVLLYEKGKNNRGFLWQLLIGLLMSAAFYLRFQMAFAMAGFGLWLLLFDKNYRHILPIAIGFAIGIGINMYLDYRFYHQWVFTPYQYYYENIAVGRAASFGTSSPVRYVLMLAMVIGAPLISIFLFYYALKSVVKRYNEPMVIATLFFVIGHCLVGHKEERFMFPILNILPVVAGFSLQEFIYYYRHCKSGIRALLKGIIGFSIALNMLALVMILFHPYSQTVEFSRKLKNTFQNTPTTLYCINRTPFETPSKLPLVFYQKSVPNLQLVRLPSADTVRNLHNVYIVTTFNDVQDSIPFLDSLGLKPVLFSSSALWSINGFLKRHKKHPINDIWVLYRKE